MRILIVSDTHGYHRNLDRALESAGAVDMFIHLGDVEGGEEYINAVVACEKHIVRGNNDFFSELPKEDEFYIGEKKGVYHPWTYLLRFPGSAAGERGRQSEERGYCHVRAYPSALSGTESGHHGAESGEPVLSAPGRAERQLYDYGTGGGSGEISAMLSEIRIDFEVR